LPITVVFVSRHWTEFSQAKNRLFLFENFTDVDFSTSLSVVSIKTLLLH